MARDMTEVTKKNTTVRLETAERAHKLMLVSKGMNLSEAEIIRRALDEFCDKRLSNAKFKAKMQRRIREDAEALEKLLGGDCDDE